MVQEAMTYVDRMPSKEERVELITTLRTVTEGKIYVEVERARLTRQLAASLEADGKVAEASEVLQEVAVETFSSMETREKADFLLEQVRATRATGDFVRMGILSNKINRKVLDEAGMEDLRLRFYSLMIELHQQRRDALALCKDYQAIYATRGFAGDAAKWKPALAGVIVYLALAPWSNETSDMLHKVKADKRSEDLPAHRALVDYLTTDELIPWPLPEPHHSTLLAHDAFTSAAALPQVAGAAAAASAASGGAATSSASSVSATTATATSTGSSSTGSVGPRISLVRKEDEERVPWGDILRKRIAQHNVRVSAKWYGRVRTARLAELLGLDVPTTEYAVSELAADKALYAKIDRPAGVVSFARPKPAAEVLSDFTGDIDAVMGLLEKARHQIEKEIMVATVLKGGKA